MLRRKKSLALLMVLVMLMTSVGMDPVKVQAAKRRTVTVSTQRELEAAMQEEQVGEIIISTKSKVTLTIPESAGSTNKRLVVNAANATLVNNGSFKKITMKASLHFTESGKGNSIVVKAKQAVITVSSKASVKSLVSNGADITLEKNAKVNFLTLKGKKASLTLKEGATIKETAILGTSARLRVNKGAKLEAVLVKKKGAVVDIIANGKVAVDVRAKADIAISGNAKSTVITVDKKAKGTVLEASTSIKLDTKATIEVTLKAGAENSTLKASDKKADVAVKNETSKDIDLVTEEGSVTIGKGGANKPEPSAKPTAQPTAVPSLSPSNGGNSSSSNNGPERVPVDQNGFDAKGRMVAYFGTPVIDGTADKVWDNAVPVTLKDAAGKTDTTAEFRVMWDDKALYVLAKVKDSALDITSGNVYQKDSIEIFLDEKNNKTKDYDADDLHFRVNYKNEQSSDYGDLSRFYTATKTVSDGYIIEARIALTEKLAKNDAVYGFELSLNDAKGGVRLAALNVFDKTGMAYADTGLFGNLLLKGKTAGSVSGLNPYDLLKLVESSKKILLDRYSNADRVRDLIAKSEAAILKADTKQKELDDLYAALDKAVEGLIGDGKDYDDKECREVPVKYKRVDEHKGTIERVSYQTKSYDAKREDRVKDFLIYLPAGYNAADKSKKYNVLYLIHGMGENQNTVFGGPGQNTEMMKILDNMIYNNKLDPMIIVTPTWTYPGAAGSTETFHNELVNDIIPVVEGKYNTYAASTSEKDLIAAREHRALGGFSAGSMTTWYTFVNRVEYFKYYMPISAGYSKDWGVDNFNGTADEKRAQYLESIVRDAGYGPNDISIFCATGTADMAYGGLANIVKAMKKYDDTFLYSANLNKGNFYFMTLEGGTHAWTSVNRYLYNMLPDLFNSKKIMLEKPGVVPVNDKGLDEANRIVANFGSPIIDGEIDPIWETAVPVSAVEVSGTPIKANFKMLWDDKAIYVLAKVKDDVLDGTSGNVYDRDSVEIFLDENNDKTEKYNKDDLHFRVSYDNKQSADNGDLSRFYTRTSPTTGGYIVEARIALTTKPANNTKFGIDLSVNDGRNGRKLGQISVFDQNNEAYKDTGKFGEVILSGRAKGAVSGLNPYDLMEVVEEANEIKLDRYKNGDVVKGLISDADAALKNAWVTQKGINNLSNKLRNAIDELIPDGKSYADKECRRIPIKYKTVDEHLGTIERISYNTNTYDGKNEDRQKDFLVYLPEGYNQNDTAKKYNVLYLIHGMGENQNTVFGGPGENTEMMKILDNMIYNKQIEPLIVVTPTWSYNGNSGDFSVIFSQTENFHNELVKDIIPAVESKYNTYAASTSEADLIAAREHRALAGFSMGSSTTWNTFASRISYFKYYMPMSLSFIKGVNVDAYEGTADEKKAQYLASVIRRAGYGPNDVSVFCATGTEDMAYGGMVNQINAMRKEDNIFLSNADLNKGNFYFMTLEGGTHTWNCVNRYLYNMLPDLFNNKTIDPSTIPARAYIEFDKNDGTGYIGDRKLNANGAVKLPTEVKMAGAELMGWSTAPNSKVVVNPAADGTYQVAAGTTTLYAVWKWSKPSITGSVNSGIITVDTGAVENIKLAVGVSGAAIRVVTGAAVSVTPSAISVGTIVAGANENFTLNILKNVKNVTGDYIIQYAAVDAGVSDTNSFHWNNISFTDNNSIIHVNAASVDRKIYIRVISNADCKFLAGDAIPLEIKY